MIRSGRLVRLVPWTALPPLMVVASCSSGSSPEGTATTSFVEVEATTTTIVPTTEIPATEEVSGTGDSGSTIDAQYWGEAVDLHLDSCSVGPGGLTVTASGPDDAIAVETSSGVPRLVWTGAHEFDDIIGVDWQAGSIRFYTAYAVDDEVIEIAVNVECR